MHNFAVTKPPSAQISVRIPDPWNHMHEVEKNYEAANDRQPTREIRRYCGLHQS